jgi:hypothetical protein
MEKHAEGKFDARLTQLEQTAESMRRDLDSLRATVSQKIPADVVASEIRAKMSPVRSNSCFWSCSVVFLVLIRAICTAEATSGT